LLQKVSLPGPAPGKFAFIGHLPADKWENRDGVKNVCDNIRFPDFSCAKLACL
jgi:hypothetical protein